jgi:hypothetical protein
MLFEFAQGWLRLSFRDDDYYDDDLSYLGLCITFISVAWFFFRIIIVPDLYHELSPQSTVFILSFVVFFLRLRLNILPYIRLLSFGGAVDVLLIILL